MPVPQMKLPSGTERPGRSGGGLIPPAAGARGGTPQMPRGLDVALAVASKASGSDGSTKPGASVSTPAGGPSAGAAFLTPRVVDQRTFEEFAGLLRRLADEADAKAAALAEVSARAERTMQAASDSARQHRAAVEVLGKLLHALNARAAEVSELVSRCDERVRALGEAERRLESVGERAVDRFEARLAARLEEIARGPAGAEVSTLVDDAERVKDELRLTLRRTEDERARVAGAAKDFERKLARLRDEAAALSARAEQATASLGQQLRAADEAGARAFQRITEAVDAAAPLETLLGSCARADSSLREGVRLAERARAEASGMSERLSELLHRADASREELRNWAGLLGTAGDAGASAVGSTGGTGRLPAPLERIVREFRTSLAQDLSKMAGAMSMIARRAETSVRRGEDGGAEIVIRAGASAEQVRAEPHPRIASDCEAGSMPALSRPAG